MSLTIIEPPLSTAFQILPLGITVKNGEEPTEQEFQALFEYLVFNRDKLRWQMAAACNLFSRYHRKNAYEKAAYLLDLSPETIETWAYIERNVPYDYRRGNLKISFHKLVAKLPPDEQRDYLDYCILNKMTYSTFERWLNIQMNIETPPVVYRSDRLHELEIDNYNLVTENSDLRKELGEKVATSQLSENGEPDYAFVTQRIINSIDNLADLYPPGIELIRQHLERL